MTAMECEFEMECEKGCEFKMECESEMECEFVFTYIYPYDHDDVFHVNEPVSKARWQLHAC